MDQVLSFTSRLSDVGLYCWCWILVTCLTDVLRADPASLGHGVALLQLQCHLGDSPPWHELLPLRGASIE